MGGGIGKQLTMDGKDWPESNCKMHLSDITCLLRGKSSRGCWFGLGRPCLHLQADSGSFSSKEQTQEYSIQDNCA